MHHPDFLNDIGETADHNAKKLNFGRFTPPPACLTSQR